MTGEMNHQKTSHPMPYSTWPNKLSLYSRTPEEKVKAKERPQARELPKAKERGKEANVATAAKLGTHLPSARRPTYR